MSPFWVSAFLDLPAERYDAGVTFWEGVTGYRRSPSRGDRDEFATLVPPDGDDYLRVQRTADGGPRVHLDLHVDEPAAVATELVDLGATVIADRGYVVLRSPHGFVFCLVTHTATARPAPGVWPGGGTSLVDQVCLDIPAAAYAEECSFWERVTGWELRHTPSSEFSSLARPQQIPIRFLLQRRDEGDDPVTAHLDLAASDRGAETARHLALGATVDHPRESWTVLRDPAGSTYCITDRNPASGMLW